MRENSFIRTGASPRGSVCATTLCSAGQLRLVVPAGSARTVGVQVYTDLADWETLGVFRNSTGTVEVSLLEVLARPQSYYRAIPLP